MAAVASQAALASYQWNGGELLSQLPTAHLRLVLEFAGPLLELIQLTNPVKPVTDVMP